MEEGRTTQRLRTLSCRKRNFAVSLSLIKPKGGDRLEFLAASHSRRNVKPRSVLGDSVNFEIKVELKINLLISPPLGDFFAKATRFGPRCFAKRSLGFLCVTKVTIRRRARADRGTFQGHRGNISRHLDRVCLSTGRDRKCKSSDGGGAVGR